MARRLADWNAPEPAYTEGVFAKYALLVSSAAEGAITQPIAARVCPGAASRDSAPP